MADTVSTKWVWPPNWDGGVDGGGPRRWVVQLKGASDGTGESAVTKIDISSLYKPDGSTPTRTIIDKIEYDVFSWYTKIKLYWDRAPEAVIAYIPTGHGCMDFTKESGLADPGESGDGTGDIKLDTSGATDGDHYNITIHFRAK